MELKEDCVQLKDFMVNNNGKFERQNVFLSLYKEPYQELLELCHANSIPFNRFINNILVLLVQNRITICSEDIYKAMS